LTVLSRPRYGRRVQHAEGSDVAVVAGHRHGSRMRTLTGTFGKTEIAVPRAGLNTSDGKTKEWKSQSLRAYQRRTLAADALIAGTYLAGTNTRRVRRALHSLFGGAVGKDIVSRVWRKVKSDWDAWNTRSLADEPIVRLILDGTVVRARESMQDVFCLRDDPRRQMAAEPAARRALCSGSRHFTLHGVVDTDADMVALFAKTIAMPLALRSAPASRSSRASPPTAMPVLQCLARRWPKGLDTIKAADKNFDVKQFIAGAR
jgi:hypothetical protein